MKQKQIARDISDSVDKALLVNRATKCSKKQQAEGLVQQNLHVFDVIVVAR